MRETLRSIEHKTRAWMLEHADNTRAEWWLAFISFFEATILPLPPSTFMGAMIVLGKKRRWVYLALLTTLTSVLGGLLGYVVGYALYDTIGTWIISQYHLADEIARVGKLFTDNAFLAIFVGAFTPIPYKAFTIGGGFFSISIVTFTVASMFGRGLRFFAVAYLANVFGEHFAARIFKYFALTTLIAIGIVALLALWGSF